MRILALDSTALTATVAITDDTTLISLYTLNTKMTHSETLLPMVESMLTNSKLKVGDIDAFACSVGPGSFTGVRIAVSLIKGLAFDTHKPCIGVSTLESLALNMSNWKGILCPVMDARRSQLYNALFKSDKNIERITDDRIIILEDLKVELEQYHENIYFIGDGYNLVSSYIKGQNICETPELLRYQNAHSVAMCAYKKYSANNFSNSLYSDIELNPVYLRASQAERERLEKKERIE